MNKYDVSVADNFTDELRAKIYNILIKIRHKYYNINIPLNESHFNIFDIINNPTTVIEKQLTFLENKEQKYETATIQFFSLLKNKNHKQYRLLLSIMYHDFCLDVTSHKSHFLDDEREIFYDIKSQATTIDKLENVVEKNPTLIFDFNVHFLHYFNLFYFDKRKSMIDNHDLDKYLQTIFPLHYLDKFYYTFPYTISSLTNIFKGFEKFSAPIAQHYSIDKTIGILGALYYSDPDNYYSLMIPLLQKYYSYTLYKSHENKMDNSNNELMEKIKNSDLEVLLTEIVEQPEFLKNVILELYNDTYLYTDKFKKNAEDNYQINTEQSVKQKLKQYGEK